MKLIQVLYLLHFSLTGSKQHHCFAVVQQSLMCWRMVHSTYIMLDAFGMHP